MSDIDPRLRWRRAMRVGTRPAPGRSDCPDADTLALLIAQPEAAPTELLSHVERCSACAAELRSLSELPELETMIEQLTVGRRRIGYLIPLAAAACLALAIGVSGIVFLQEAVEPVVRSSSTVDLSPADGAVLDQVPEVLSWNTALGQRYRFSLYDESAHRLWRSEAVESGEIALPDHLRNDLAAGRYYWQLHIVGTGTVMGPYTFEIDPRNDDDS
jgi:hypothetical protein